MSPTMKDVANLAEVSKSTVSFVLNDKPGISAETIERVLRAAEILGYTLPKSRPIRRPSAQQKYFTVVHQVGNEETENIYGLFAVYLHGIRTYAQKANINITAISGYRKGDLEQLEAQIFEDLNAPLDGLIHMGVGIHRESSLIQRAHWTRIPQVVINRNWPDLNISTVSQDHQMQTQYALNHLAGLGHRKVGFIANQSDLDYEGFETRLSHYKELIPSLYKDPPKSWIYLGENGADSARELVRNHPEITAILAVHDGRAIEVMEGLLGLGLRIPEDISVIGLDGSEKTPYGYPELSTVSVSHFDMGCLAAELLHKLIENENIEYGNLVVSCKTVPGESCRKIDTGLHPGEEY